MLKLRDTLLLSSKKLSQRKVSTFFSGCFIALGAIILLVSSIAIYSVTQFLNSSNKGIEDNEPLVKINEVCNSADSNTSIQNSEVTELEEEISANNQTLIRQKDILTPEQVELIEQKNAVSQAKLDEIKNSKKDNDLNTCASNQIDKAKIIAEEQKIKKVYVSEEINYNSEIDQSIKIDGILSGQERIDKLGSDYESRFSSKNLNRDVVNFDQYFEYLNNVYKPITKTSEIAVPNISFQTYENERFYSKYIYKDYKLNSDDSNIANIIVPFTILQYFSEKEVASTEIDIFSSILNIDKSYNDLVVQRNLMDKWIGKEISLSVYSPTKVAYTENTDKLTSSLFKNIEQISEYKKLGSIAKFRIVGYTDSTNSKILISQTEFKKLKINEKITPISPKISETISYAGYLSFENKNSKSDFLKKFTANFNIFSIGQGGTNFKVYGIEYQVSDFSSSVTTFISVLESIQSNFLIYLGYGLLGIAGVIILLILSKTVTESTKEIAIFRSFGAKRFDISQIYFAYVTEITVIGFGFALLGSYLILLFADYSPANKFMEVLIFSTTLANINGNSFSFISSPILQILYVFGVTILFGIIAAIFPIIRAVRIQPIIAMRNDQ